MYKYVLKKCELDLAQPHMIEQTFIDFKMDGEKINTKDIPAISKLLSRDLNGGDLNKIFHHRSVIGKLNNLEQGTRSDISFLHYTPMCQICKDPRENSIYITYFDNSIKKTSVLS